MLQTVPVGALPPERYRQVLTGSRADVFEHALARASEDLHGRVVWNVNSTASGGGVAELLHTLLAYARGAGVDARWVVIEGNADFFRVTKRIHNRLHGVDGDGGPLGDEEHAIYDAVARANAAELAKLIMPGDIVLLHDPQTGGLTQPMLDAGALVVWRCHVGIDRPNELSRSAWDFVRPYVAPAMRYVFSREEFEWEGLDRARMVVIRPSIDAFSPKNEQLEPGAVEAILAVAGLAPEDGRREATYVRQDGSAGRVDRRATLWEDATVPADAPLVTQVSRWDRLKDPMGVMDGFVVSAARETSAHLVLAGPDVTAIADDPEGLAVLEECIGYRRGLDPPVRARVHLAALPMDDAEENAAVVNALQRRATIVVQKSLAEGFGLTVSEAMWKGRPVVASRIGGIQDQIVDGVSGLLVDPRDQDAYAQALVRLLHDPAEAERIGRAAHARVRDEFLGPRHLAQYLELFDALLGVRQPAERA
jgi:trehalose synthase